MVFINNMAAMLRQMHEHKLRSNNTDKYEVTCRVMHNYGKQVKRGLLTCMLLISGFRCDYLKSWTISGAQEQFSPNLLPVRFLLVA